MGRVISFIYGLLCWIGFLLVFSYTALFLGGFLVPKTVNSGAVAGTGQAVLINILLLAAFGIHHSVAARPWFKAHVIRYMPKHLERSTYVLMSDLLLACVLWQWRPIPTVIWDVQLEPARTILYVLFGSGWLLIVLSSFMIHHFDLLGVRQVYLHLIGREYTSVPFKSNFLYKYIRNPLMLGWFVALWCTPYMTVGHFVFSMGLTIYGIIGIICEERMHAKHLGKVYEDYRKKTPMLIPFLKKDK